MSNRINAVLRGIGTATEVYDQHILALQQLGQSTVPLSNLVNALLEPDLTKEQQLAMWAVVAAKLNQMLDLTGELYAIADTGRLRCDYIASDSQRRLMLDLMAG